MGIDLSIDTNKVFSDFKKLTPALISIMVITGLILFLPQSILEKMALDNLSDTARRIIGIIFLLSSALTVTIILFSIFENVISERKYKRFRINQRKKLEKLSISPKQIIFSLLHSYDKMIRLNPNSGDVLYLKTNLFIYEPTQVFSVDYDNNAIMTYAPHPWLLDLFNETPELFK